MVRRLLYLNGLAALAVVLNHAASRGFIAMFAWTDRFLPVTEPNFDLLGSASYYALSLVKQLIIFGVPAFLFVSGFFIAFAAGRSQSTVSWQVVWSRIKFLLIPYLLWSIFFLSIQFVQGERYSVLGYLVILATGKAAPPFYYVPLLCQLLLLSPWIVPLARDRWKPLLIITGMILLILKGLGYIDFLGIESPVLETFIHWTPTWFFPSRMFWFVFGVVAGFHLQPLKQWLARFKWGLLATAIILVPLGVYEWRLIHHLSLQEWAGFPETLLDSVYAGAFILSFIAFDQVTYPFSKQLNSLGSKSYGIYLIHSPTLSYASRGIYHLAPWIMAYQGLFQLILIAVGLGVPLLLMKLGNISPARRFYAYIFG